jgi:hypothetical protein
MRSVRSNPPKPHPPIVLLEHCPSIVEFLKRVLPVDEPERHFDLVMDWAGYCLIASGRYN